MKYFDIHRIWSYCIASILGFLEPIWALILWMLIFILSDMITGIYAAYCKGEKITSHKMQRTVIKFLMYAGSIILLEGLDVYFITYLECGLARIGATIICGIELYSIFENCYKATGNIVFKVLTQFTSSKLKEKTGVNIHHRKRK
ncbi:MAG: phage holin family protein [Acutalibacteraceae bacterium]|nr:phage holin family protein [Acutalibacteraceae bacterium]